MRTRAQKKASSRANALRRGEENARRRGEPGPRKTRTRAEGPADPVRDGLVWLIRKGRLTLSRQMAAAAYRAAFREPQEGAMRSCLDLSPGGVRSGTLPDVNAGRVDAVRRLHAMRTEALLGQEDMIFVMDGVCGGGLTLRELAGGEDRRAGRLEAVLMVALDLVGAWEARGACSLPERHPGRCA